MDRVLIVGGRSGIGQAIAQDLKSDYIVETLSRNKSDSMEFIHHQLDVICEGSLVNYFEKIEPFDHLIVTAADVFQGSILSLTNDQVKHNIDNKFLLSYLSARDIKWKKSLTLFSGYLSVRPRKNTSLLSGINSGIEGLTRGLAVEFSPARVNCISPGTIFDDCDGVKNGGFIDDTMGINIKQSLVGRFGKNGDICSAVRFSLECEFLTSEIIYVDGGLRYG